MKKVTAALAVLLALALTGCAAGKEDAGDESTQPVASASATPEATADQLPVAVQAEPTPTIEPGPIQHAPESTPEADPGTGENAYIASAQEYLSDWGYRSFTDEQILSAGLYACESSDPDVIIIEGIDPLHNVEIVSRAHAMLCP